MVVLLNLVFSLSSFYPGTQGELIGQGVQDEPPGVPTLGAASRRGLHGRGTALQATVSHFPRTLETPLATSGPGRMGGGEI